MEKVIDGIKFIPLVEYGYYVGEREGVLFYSHMFSDGGIDEDYCMVMEPSVEFLASINRTFCSSYSMSNFK